jgi:hypothetical protein
LTYDYAQVKANTNMVHVVDETSGFVHVATFSSGLWCGQPGGAARNDDL